MYRCSDNIHCGKLRCEVIIPETLAPQNKQQLKESINILLG